MTEGAAGGLAYEDLVPGWKRTFPPRTVSREDIVRFAREWDPQPFHLDEQAARRTHFGGLVAAPVFSKVMGFALRAYEVPPTATKPTPYRLTVPD